MNVNENFTATGDSKKFGGQRVAALADHSWKCSQWLSATNSIIANAETRKAKISADGISWFIGEVENEADVESALWMTTGLGVYEIYVNGTRVGNDILKPGYTHVRKTRRSFTYDVTELIQTTKGAKNQLAAQVSGGWWRDQIVFYAGQRSAFRGVLQITYKDGATKQYGTNIKTWKAGLAGNVKRAAIFDGEIFDARATCPLFDSAVLQSPIENKEFSGVILPSDGAEVVRREDLALLPIEAYCWSGVTNANDKTGVAKNFGTIIKTCTFDVNGELSVAPGETLILDFGQNAAAIPSFTMRAKRDTVMTCLPSEILNDQNGERARGNDGPGGSIYRENFRIPNSGMRVVYTFTDDQTVTYSPRLTFFGYRYLSITATDTVIFSRVKSIPITSITKAMERGTITTGEKDVNKLIANIYWGQLSNYLSIPTDCPQRNERLGWTADTQVFAEAGSFNADTTKFFHKWMRDLVDSRDAAGGFPSVAPYAQYGNDTFKFGWADAGVIVPWTIWKQFGDVKILTDNWDAMVKFVRTIDQKKYKYDNQNYIYADWLSYETFETCGNKFGDWTKWRNHPDAKNYREFLAACYWLYDAQLMVQMAQALDKSAEAEEFRACEKRARDYIRAMYVEPDGLLLKPMRHLQTACIFALKFGLVEGRAFDETKALLLTSIQNHGDCLQTGFLGTSFIMDTLTQIGASDVAYTLLLQHKNPSWLYSVDQGATTVWERWNSYTKESGFGPVGMNSFNHYAYGAVLAWIYKTVAGIASCPDEPGFKTIVMQPQPDKRLGFVKAEYRAPTGLIKSAWRYEGDKWIWDFTIPSGATARVTLPGATEAKTYAPGTYHIER